MSKYIQRKDGDGWTIQNGVPFRIACCDCGLCHLMVVVTDKLPEGEMLGVAALQNRRATAAKRRKKK